jgi:hypothetical protein
MTIARLGYTKKQSEITGNIFIPRYYDPSISRRLSELGATHDLMTLGQLVNEGALRVLYGHDIGKMSYGGHIPYVRTSDLTGWELVLEPKQAVDDAVYERYARKQDVAAGDVMFVRDGLYLIGSSALVTPSDLPLIHQSHLVRFRVAATSPIAAPLLPALFSTPIVRRQVRSKQFTAGIIDKIEDRYRELVIPVPKAKVLRKKLTDECASIISRRVELRERLRRIPSWVQGLTASPEEPVPRRPEDTTGYERRLGFARKLSETLRNVLIPKYYDPSIDDDLSALRKSFELRTISELVTDGLLQIQAGIEVGKLAYGTGPIPFVRTSDLSDWELRGEPKHRVSEGLYERFKDRVGVRPNDIFLVRDGTYLVGTSAIVSARDARLLYAGGLYKIRSTSPDQINPHLLLAILNTPIVKRQIQAKRFTRDIIDTLGRRLFQIVLPFPKSPVARREIADLVHETVQQRAKLRERAKAIALEIEGPEGLDEDEQVLLAEEPE